MSKNPIDRSNAEHYIWADVCDGWRLLSQTDIAVIEERMPAGAKDHVHKHARSTQLFYVLSGELQIEIEGKTVVGKAGQALHVPKGAAHYLANVTQADAIYLSIASPAIHEDREDLDFVQI
jgi:quercetin dioxygenase-like cupin family protein